MMLTHVQRTEITALLHRAHRACTREARRSAQTMEGLQRLAPSDPRAAFELALCFALGIGVGAWPTRAAYWYGEAARAGHAGAMFALSVCHLYGFGTSRSFAESDWWLRRCTYCLQNGSTL
jgi:TPR repeat protein